MHYSKEIMEEFFKEFLREYGASFKEDTLHVTPADHNNWILDVTVEEGFEYAVQALKKKVACLESSCIGSYEGDTLYWSYEIEYHAPAVDYHF